MTEYNTTAVAFGDLKNTALYFDYVIPVFLAADLGGVKGSKGVGSLFFLDCCSRDKDSRPLYCLLYCLVKRYERGIRDGHEIRVERCDVERYWRVAHQGNRL